MKTQTKLATLALSTVAISMQFSSAAQAQIIDFETLPNGATPSDNQRLLFPYTLSNGTSITFGFDTNNDLNIDYVPRIESRLDGNNTIRSYTAFSFTNPRPDYDRTPEKSGGQFLLRPPLTTSEGANLNLFKNVPGATPAAFLAKYTGTPVNSVAGELWDVDNGERYFIEALTGNGTLISSFLTPAIPDGEGADTYDGKPYKFSFANL